MKSNAGEGLVHAHRAGEMVTLLGGHPSLKIGSLLETEKHDIGDILRESLEHEQAALFETLADPAFYQSEGDAIAVARLRLAAVETELAQAYGRWEELDTIDRGADMSAS